MASVNFLDMIDKCLHFSAKMIGESSKLSSTSYFMSGSGNNDSMSQQMRSFDILSALMGESVFNGVSENTSNPLKQSLRHLRGNFFTNYYDFGRYLLYPMNNCSKIVNHCPDIATESYFTPNSKLVNHLISSVLLNQSSEMVRNFKSNFDDKTVFKPSVIEFKMSKSEPHSVVKNSEDINSSCVAPSASTLNKEYANRKTKEMLKRSKKRRRRQKKNKVLDHNSVVSVSDDEVNCSVISPISSRICLFPHDSDFKCSVTVRHSVSDPSILPPFIVTVDSASDDDSEWEFCDVEQCNSNSPCDRKTNTINTVSRPIKSESLHPLDCNYLKASSLLSSFLVPAGSPSDDESDWDSCETDVSNEALELEFPGLFMTNISTLQILSSGADNNVTSDEDDEVLKLKLHLKKVNEDWNESTKGVEGIPKLSTKVSFAPEETLVEVFPADACERKGEWEKYSTERLRFQRRIDELEKILSPCLMPEHRLKIFKKLNTSAL